MTVNWTPTARETFFIILEYLDQTWTKREVQKFIEEVQKVLSQIEDNPEMFPVSKEIRNLRKGFITKHTSFYYRIKLEKKELELITFWDNRQDPVKKSELQDL